ncbi:MAG TPA: ATP-binding protein [Gemmatimonadales bacterium]|nr:ATP-binding protein [Gemmatimonadales bacterium]
MASTQPGGRIGLPDQRTLLGWLFAFRIAIATLLLVRASFVWSDRPENSFYVATGVLLFFVITAYGAYQVLLKRLEPSVGFFISQALADLAVVSGLVRVGGEASTALAAMYVVVIAVYALLLPTWAGITVALAAGGAYVIASLLANDGSLPPGLWGQIIVFGFVFLLVAVLGHRLQHSVAAQSHLETELQRVRYEAEEVLRSIKTGVITVNGKGRLAFVNPAGERLLGLPSPARMGQPVLEYLGQVAPELQAAVSAGLERGHRVARGEGTVHTADGRVFPIGLSTTTFAQTFDGLPAVTALFTDLSDHKQLQELHLRAERLEAVAALSASLAHEIRNPLASIRSSVEQLALSAQADEDERTLGHLIVRESDRLSRLLGEFLDFSRVRAVRFTPVNLFAVASETARMVRERPECGEEMNLEVRGDAILIEADEDLLHRVVSNLAINAVQACKGKGTVSITVGPAHPSDLPPGADLEMPVQVIVEDDGPGIDPDLIDRLFEPFVSRRAGGSGLGLAIVQRAVEAHRGLVLVDSNPGKGARFTVYLPSRPFRESAA